MRSAPRLFDLACLLVVSAAAVPSAGCRHSATPYEPSRVIARAIPAEAARAVLREVLARQWVRTRENKLRDIHVDEEGFGYTYKKGILTSETSKRYRYADLSPHLYRVDDGGYFFVSLTGPFDPGFLNPDYNLDNDCLWFAPEGSESPAEQAERLCDALESLKAHAASAPPAPATPAAPSRKGP